MTPERCREAALLPSSGEGISINTVCCSAAVIGTKRMLGRLTVSQLAAASTLLSLLPRLTYGLT